MPVQERLDRLLDKKTPWLESAPLAAFVQYDKMCTRRATVRHRLVAGREVVSTASDPMIKAARCSAGRQDKPALPDHAMEIIADDQPVDSGGAFLPLQSRSSPTRRRRANRLHQAIMSR
jgi:hypothetical protein